MAKQKTKVKVDLVGLIEKLTGRTLQEEIDRVANDPVLQAKFRPENRIGNTMFFGSREDYEKYTKMGVKF
jgi:hypothetical protein